MQNDMKKKVVIMVSAPLTTRWASYFCTDDLCKHFDLEYWDCSLVAYPAFKGRALERDYVRTPKTTTEFEQMLKALPKDTLIVSDIHLVKQNYDFHKLVSRYFKNRIYVDFWSNLLSKMDEPTEAPKPEKRSLKQRLYQIGWLQVLIKFIRYKGDARFKQFYAFYKEERDINKSLREEKACENLYTNHIFTCLPHQKYSINHPDYEKYLALQGGKRLIKEPYIVFIDQYYPYHPDFKEVNSEMDCEQLARWYYPSMNHFFDVVEKQTGMKVVIAAHPIADYSQNPYGGRDIYLYKTAELIRDCEYVCMHHSFSISFVALYDKPVCFIANKAVRGSGLCYNGIHGMAKTMNMPIIDSDRIDEYKDSVFTKIPNERRDLYNNCFFDLNENKHNSELLVMHLNKIYKEIFEK